MVAHQFNLTLTSYLFLFSFQLIYFKNKIRRNLRELFNEVRLIAQLKKFHVKEACTDFKVLKLTFIPSKRRSGMEVKGITKERLQN